MVLKLLLICGLLTYCNTELFFDSNFNTEWSVVSERMPQPKCVNIPSEMKLCHGIDYDMMRVPNLLEHDNLDEVISQADNWVPLIGIRCHPDTQVFLCSLFSPVCLESVIYPCRSLCENVSRSCEGYMKSYGFTWPEMFRCDKFPEDTELCIPGISSNSEVSSRERVCQPCQEADTYEGILHNYCKADYVVRATVKQLAKVSESAEPGEVEIEMGKRKKKFYKKNDSLPKRIYKQLADKEAKIYMKDAMGCSCDSRIQSGEHHLLGIQAVEKYDRMGQKITKFYVQFITPWKDTDGKAQKSIKKALRTVRKREDLCEGGLSTLNADDSKQHKKSKRDRRERKRRQRRQ